MSKHKSHVPLTRKKTWLAPMPRTEEMMLIEFMTHLRNTLEQADYESATPPFKIVRELEAREMFYSKQNTGDKPEFPSLYNAESTGWYSFTSPKGQLYLYLHIYIGSYQLIVDGDLEQVFVRYTKGIFSEQMSHWLRWPWLKHATLPFEASSIESLLFKAVF